MKRIGLLAGMSWESSLEYYRLLNEMTRDRLGGLSSAPCVMSSVDFAPLARAMHEGRWSDVAAALVAEARRVEGAGAELLLLCTNSIHKVAGEIAAAVKIPFLHIVDPTGEAVAARGIGTVGLLGTRFTMEDGFYAERLERDFGLRVLVPDADDRALVHRVIFDELCCGQVKPESRAAYAEIMSRLAARGARAVILGCTEIAMLVSQEDAAVPLFDTTRLHAAAAVERALGEGTPKAYARGPLGLAT